MVDEHFFDILGIGAREDSYTDLIAYALNSNSEFQRSFMNLLVKDDSDPKFETHVRKPVSIKSQAGARERNRDVPDLVLVDREKNRIILIESKLFSGEGWDQTKRYASEEFRASLARQHDLTNPEIINYFLTLDELQPESSHFQAMKLKDVTDCVPDKVGTTKLDMLLKEFQYRVQEHHNWPPPSQDDIVLKYLKNTKRLISRQQTFRKFGESLLDALHDFEKKFYATANRGCALIPLVLFYKMPHWASEPMTASTNDGRKNFNIHFEFQWYTREPYDHLSLYVHYETCPYKTRNELNKKNDNFVIGYEETRDAFFSRLNTAYNLINWKLKKSFLQIACYEFDKNITFGDLKSKTLDLVKDMTEVLDDCIDNTLLRNEI